MGATSFPDDSGDFFPRCFCVRSGSRWVPAAAGHSARDAGVRPRAERASVVWPGALDEPYPDVALVRAAADVPALLGVEGHSC